MHTCRFPVPQMHEGLDDQEALDFMKDGMALNAPMINDVNDCCLAMGEGTTETISEFQVEIEPTTSVTLVLRG